MFSRDFTTGDIAYSFPQTNSLPFSTPTATRQDDVNAKVNKCYLSLRNLNMLTSSGVFSTTACKAGEMEGNTLSKKLVTSLIFDELDDKLGSLKQTCAADLWNFPLLLRDSSESLKDATELKKYF